MILLALTCERVCPDDEQLNSLLMKGELNVALRTGLERLDRTVSAREPERHAMLSQLMGRALLAADRTEDAEELLHSLPKCYEAISRNAVRWYSSLDQAALSLHTHKWGRAAEASNLVADDDSAPPALRIEAMAILAMALHRMGEHRRSLSTLHEAARRAEEARLHWTHELVQALELELIVRFRLETCEGLCDYALGVTEAPCDIRDGAGLAEALREQRADFAEHELLERHFEMLSMLAPDAATGSARMASLRQTTKWLRDGGFASFETALRIDAALMLLAHDDGPGAADVLGTLALNERMAHRHRHGLELTYCASKLHALGGRQGEALRTYKEYAKEALYRANRERSHLPHSRFLEKQAIAEHADAAMLRLPLRYRHAYRFILERLDDRRLSIKQVAAHIDVTERALQMAFRTHLGMTPAQLIRYHRMEGIRNELRDSAGRTSVLKTAARWGMNNRSTLAHNYRQQFAETPTGTLRGGF